MSMNVFGHPISISTLQGMVEYSKKVEEKDERKIRLYKARVAFDMKNARGNDLNVCKFVESIGHEVPEKYKVMTYCVMYNATGDTMTLVRHHWDDTVNQFAYSHLPVTIANGQWAGFVHVGDHVSRGYVVYRVKDEHGVGGFDYVFGWNNDQDGNNNKVYTQIYSAEDDNRYLSLFERAIVSHGGLVHTKSIRRCNSSVATGRGIKAFVEAIFSLDTDPIA